MANIKSAKKRAIQGERRRQHNASQRSGMRTSLKKALAAIEEGSDDAAAKARTTVSLLDKYAAKGLVHRNRAARQKRRLAGKLKAASITP